MRSSDIDPSGRATQSIIVRLKGIGSVGKVWATVFVGIGSDVRMRLPCFALQLAVAIPRTFF